MNKNISLDLYKIFCVVVRTGNMSAAAKELFISQPAVSMAIHQLEEKIGSALLIRTSKGVKTTPEGAVLFEHLDKALNLIVTAERKYDQMVNMEKGELRISAGDTVITKYLLPYIKEYTELYPGISIKISNGTSKECLDELKNSIADFCFVNLPFEDSTDDFNIRECFKLHGCVVGGSKYKNLAKTGVDFETLDSYPLILLSKKTNTRNFIDGQAIVRGKIFEPSIEVESSEIEEELVKANLGLTITFRELVNIDNESIFEIPCNVSAPDRYVGIATLKKITLSTAAKRFVELLGMSEE